jgi:Rrf2 family protein
MEDDLISQTAEYALRAAVCLASNREAPMTTQQIAAMAKVPAGYLSKVLQAMGRAGLVDSTRGLGGGFVLMRDPKDLTIYEVIEAVDPVQRIHTCPLGIKSHGENLCPLHRRLDDAMAMVERAFRDSTIAELLRTGSKSKPLCEVQGVKKE